MINRRGMVFGFLTGAAALSMASAAFACVTFMGKVNVVGADGATEVVGKGNAHGYCSTGRPTTAAAGNLGEIIKITASEGTCGDTGALATGNKLPAGSYQVRFNNELSYGYDGTYWTMVPETGCFHPLNTATSSTIGSFDIDANGDGSWEGTLDADDVNGGPPVYATPLTASNICIGLAGKGMLAPFQLLAI